jgi:hypothetical protein
LLEEQLKLGTFIPLVQHSFAEGAKPVMFHPQMLADFMTIHDLARRILAELDGRTNDRKTFE